MNNRPTHDLNELYAVLVPAIYGAAFGFIIGYVLKMLEY